MNSIHTHRFPSAKHTRIASLVLLQALMACQLTLTASAETLDLETATIPQLEAAMTKGKLTSAKLTELYLKRIDAYDKKGPAINAVITLNPHAVEIAKALDKERKAKGPRSPIHGIPIVLKDNFDTFDLPTTAGSQLLEGSIPPDDAYVVKKLREAGAVIVAKVNLSEFAGSGGSTSGAPPEIAKKGRVPNGFSSMGLQTHNPHDLTKGPSGSSGGTGASIAAAFAQFGLGTDTGGSVRGPSSANGIVGLKPTHGLMSRDGIVPLALSFDTGGPMARSVTDIAIALGIMTGVDPADPATSKSAGKFETDYTKYLKPGALKGARIGIARDFMGVDKGTDAVVEQAIATLKSLGAEVIDPIKYPGYVLATRQPIYNELVASEFKAQITQYLHTLKPGYPTSFDEIVAKANDPATGYRSPEKAVGLKYTASIARDLDDPEFLAIKNQALDATMAGVLSVFKKYKLDAIVYPTSPRPATPIIPDDAAAAAATGSPTNIANQTGFPDLIVPAGMTAEGLPVTISFFGTAFSEAKLIGYAYDFEQATKAIHQPKYTPALPTDIIKY